MKFNPSMEYGNTIPLLRGKGWKSKVVRHVLKRDALKHLPKGTYYEIRRTIRKLPTIDDPFPYKIAWYYHPHIPHRILNWRKKLTYNSFIGCYIVGRFKT